MGRLGLIAVLLLTPWMATAQSFGAPQYGRSKLPPSQQQAAPQQAAAPQPRAAAGERMVNSGTGFFVSNRGFIVTNAHVVKGCKQVQVRGAVKASPAAVLATDEEYDLALVQTQAMAPAVAGISQAEYRIRIGDQVTVIGYPLDHGVTGLYDVKQARVTDLKGPLDEPHWIQFSSAAQQGNSGGPLLDASGNVIGVVTGKAQKIVTGPGGKTEVVGESDVAISLPVLKAFLDKHRVYYRDSRPGGRLSSGRIENKASNFIVNIHCILPRNGDDPAAITAPKMALPPGYTGRGQ